MRRPLKLVEIYLLFALGQRPMHGYALVEAIRRESEGSIELYPGNLYSVLQRLRRAGWVRPAPTPAGGEGDSRRRYYEITGAGSSRLADELRRMERLAARARRRGALNPSSSTDQETAT